MSTDTIISGDTSLIDKSLTEKQIRGVDLVVKSASKNTHLYSGGIIFTNGRSGILYFILICMSIGLSHHNFTMRRLDNIILTILRQYLVILQHYYVFDASIGDKDKNFMKGYNAGTN